MASSAKLIIDIQSYWHPGTGQGLGSHLDAVTHRGADKLPALPGKTVKGLLRDAVNRWEKFGGYADKAFATVTSKPSLAERLFGPPPEIEESEQKFEEVHQQWTGLLRFSDARLNDSDRQYLKGHKELMAGLYRRHFSTAIEHESGTALVKSLRGIEIIVPLTLYADIECLNGNDELAGHWTEILRDALPLVRAVGAHRSRGLGRAVLALQGAK